MAEPRHFMTIFLLFMTAMRPVIVVLHAFMAAELTFVACCGRGAVKCRGAERAGGQARRRGSKDARREGERERGRGRGSGRGRGGVRGGDGAAGKFSQPPRTPRYLPTPMLLCCALPGTHLPYRRGRLLRGVRMLLSYHPALPLRVFPTRSPVLRRGMLLPDSALKARVFAPGIRTPPLAPPQLDPPRRARLPRH
eukprot:2853121-Rhodomonas_salina.1